ncbi:MAG: hypothetical protein ACM3SY_04830 [Candidatus Omnitrophota bacterium]
MEKKSVFDGVIEEGIGFKWIFPTISIIGIASLIIAIVVWYNGGCAVSPSKNSKNVQTPELMADMSTKLNDLSITNKNNFAWTLTTLPEGVGIAIEINGKYRFIYDRCLNAGERINLKLSEFADPSGLRFDFVERKVLTVSVNCNEGYTIYKNGNN